VRGINRYGRSSQGVRVMNLREGDEVSAVALVVESGADAENGDGAVAAAEVAGVAPEDVVEVAPDDEE
jgi:DNA gyrase subunit A